MGLETSTTSSEQDLEEAECFISEAEKSKTMKGQVPIKTLDLLADEVLEKQSRSLVPEKVTAATLDQKICAAKFFDEAEIISKKSKAVLGSARKDLKTVKQSNEKVTKEWEAQKKLLLKEILDRKPEAQAYLIPDNYQGQISEKFIELCGDANMRVMAKRFVPKDYSVPLKALNMLGSTQLLPPKAKKLVGKDPEERLLENGIQQAIDESYSLNGPSYPSLSSMLRQSLKKL